DDAVGLQFQRMLAGIGSSEAAYDSTPGSATRNAANAWLAANTISNAPGVTRNPDTQQAVRVVRQSANISSVRIDPIDRRPRYSSDRADSRSYEPTLTASYYTDLRYDDLSGGGQDALGQQNATPGIVPPMLKLKGSLRLNWFMGQQSAA